MQETIGAQITHLAGIVSRWLQPFYEQRGAIAVAMRERGSVLMCDNTSVRIAQYTRDCS